MACLGEMYIKLTLLWPAGHIHPTYKESFQVRWDNSVPLFLHAAIYLEVSLFRWTSQNAFSRETAVYKWYCVQCCYAALHGIELLQGRWQHGEKVGYCYPSRLEKTLCKCDIYVPLVTRGLNTFILIIQQKCPNFGLILILVH